MRYINRLFTFTYL